MKRIWIDQTPKHVGSTVLIKGWVHIRRDMGKIAFLEIRDRSGIVQVVCSPEDLDQESQIALREVRPEFVIEIEGMVNERPEKQINPKLVTGTIEMVSLRLAIINRSKTPPFEVNDERIDVNEEVRMEYRYIDLRREGMRRNMEMRHRVIKFCRDFLDKKDFLEIETPILTKSTPEGARDYLVPVRQQPGKFFALPQSPQQYKQLLMVGGLERYFQFARCFRDEDQRGDRQPEFTQLDIELSFVTQKEILKLTETMITKMVKKIYPDKKMKTPWPRLKYKDVMEKYGTDSPDLRENKEDPNELAFAWMIDWPLFSYDEETRRYDPEHHIFTSPNPKDLKKLEKNPGKVRSLQHDLVLNGSEVAGGSIRIHDPQVQRKIFELVGLTPEESEEKFSHLLRAFEYGVPPHGGIAVGFER